ncbi:helix-turn-helix transcriptional regulator [Leucothrix pacifica]|uniref:DNA-binding transcriptional regulator n=1 Tax=Leucothrix pacifica TaxID=1247513 RepID=A0A317C7B8_9GAMM|nr:YafY family protein [Leucothrix pacifica]PWQ93313.1 DNA-binding transcriptional regulator [Leucothrix pacifica]
MRRADRLFQIVQILRNKRLVTAQELADRLEVSPRTIYRDIQDLSLSGVPVEGEAGVGYHLRYSLDIPPLMFNADEVEALVLGSRMLQSWGGAELGTSAQSVMDKVYAVIPEELRQVLDGSKLYAPRFGPREDLQSTLDICRKAIHDHQYLKLTYQRADEALSQREVKPLGLFFWGHVWTLSAWCELRGTFRTFRLDRMKSVDVLDRCFEEQAGQTLQDCLAQMYSASPDEIPNY